LVVCWEPVKDEINPVTTVVYYSLFPLGNLGSTPEPCFAFPHDLLKIKSPDYAFLIVIYTKYSIFVYKKTRMKTIIFAQNVTRVLILLFLDEHIHI
jgi:hypothetical protein